MKTLFYSYTTEIYNTYIIRLKNNIVSENMAMRCAASCDNIGQPYEFWDAYDASDKKILIPSHHTVTMDLIKVTDHYLTRGEVATALSHISLWVHCIILDKPIVILEHDAIMLRPYRNHSIFNSIAYLGCSEQKNKGWQVLPTPVHGSEGPNYHFIGRAHAYAIDPAIAKNLLAHVIKYGICAPLDIMIRADIFPIHQPGLIAYDASDAINTTIKGRPEKGRMSSMNVNLEI